MSVSVEVMDCTFGRPAEGVPVTLMREVEASWHHAASARTDAAGCVPKLNPTTVRGRYRLTLELDEYFPALGIAPFQSLVDVTFRVFSPAEAVHFLMLVTPSSTSICRLVTGEYAQSRAPHQSAVPPPVPDPRR